MGCIQHEKKIVISDFHKPSNNSIKKIEINDSPKKNEYKTDNSNQISPKNVNRPHSSKNGINNLYKDESLEKKNRHVESMKKLRLITENELHGSQKFFK